MSAISKRVTATAAGAAVMFFVFGSLVSLSLAAGPASATGAAADDDARPLPADAAAGGKQRPSTWYDYRDAMLELNKRTLAGAYKQVGTHGPWDEKAVAFLDRMAVYFTTGRLNWVYQPKDAVKSHEELIVAGKAVLDAGCTDPLIEYCYGAALNDSGKPAEALPHVQRAVDGLEKSGYPPARIAGAAARLGRLDLSPATMARTREIVRVQRLKNCCGKLDGIGRRQAANDTWDDIESWPRADQVAFVDALGKMPDADPWSLNLLDGIVEVKVAWDFRGSGWANKVTPEGWRGFYEHLTKARNSLVAAYKLAPQLPEPCIEMITVAMGAGDRLGEDRMLWFNRARVAQLDHANAYSYMFNASLPRWGGDFGAMYNIGVSAAQTDRYDTIAPWQFVRAMQAIVNDAGGEWGPILARPGIYDGMAEVSDKYAAQVVKMGRTDQWHTTFRAALAWRAGRFKEARKFLDKAGDRIEFSAFREFGSQDPPAAVGNIYAMSSPHADETTQAENAFRGERYDEALKIYKTIAAAADVHPRMKPYLDMRMRVAERRAKFARGEWMDVQPGKDLAGWKAAAGIWRVIDDAGGQLHGELAPTLKFVPSIMCDESVGTRFEFSGVMTPEGHSANPGVVIGVGAYPMFYTGIAAGAVYMFSSDGFKQTVPTDALADLHESARFVMTYDNGKLSLQINEKLALDKFQLPPQVMRDPRIGVFTNVRAGSRFGELKVRRLPDAAAKPDDGDDKPDDAK